ncbi:MAG: hypothetical protein JWM96_1149, partial [Alphaproteobacteria bacterium]|nr:hypothetical protein [Alphaproteobacteria bacterium]
MKSSHAFALIALLSLSPALSPSFAFAQDAGSSSQGPGGRDGFFSEADVNKDGF